MPYSYRQLGIFYYHINMVTHGTAFGEPVDSAGGQVDNMPSEANKSCQAQTWMAHLTDRDADHYAVVLPHVYVNLTDVENVQSKDPVFNKR